MSVSSKVEELVGDPDEDVLAPCTGTGGKPSKPKRIKRPMNAFMVWSSVERKKLAEKEPQVHNTELSKQLGHIWKAMTELEKLPFRKEADKLKSKLMEEHPDYKYKPKRKKVDVNNRNSLWGNMKVHDVSGATNQRSDNSRYSTSVTTSTASSHCRLLQPPKTAWNSHLYPVHDPAYCCYPCRSVNAASACTQLSTTDQIPYGSNIPTLYANHAVPFGIPLQFSSNAYIMSNGYGYKTGEPSSEVLQPLHSSTYNSDTIPTPTDSENSYNKTFSNPVFTDELQSIKKEPTFDSDLYRFPLETPPRSPYIASPNISTVLPYPLDEVHKESTKRKLGVCVYTISSW